MSADLHPLDVRASCGVDLRLGRYQDALADVERVDAVIVDPPYGARVHNADGQRADGQRADGLKPGYTHWTAVEITDFLASWSPRCEGWIVALACSDLAPVWQDAFFAVGRYGFSPVPCVIRGMSVRLAGDGPSSWTVYACAGRPTTKKYATWGTLDGAYVGNADRYYISGQGRGKPQWLPDRLVRDYTRPGDLVCDPCAGWGSTLIAARNAGRSAVGSEADPATLAAALANLSGDRTEFRRLVGETREPKVRAGQGDLFDPTP